MDKIDIRLISFFITLKDLVKSKSHPPSQIAVVYEDSTPLEIDTYVPSSGSALNIAYLQKVIQSMVLLFPGLSRQSGEEHEPYAAFFDQILNQNTEL